MEKLTDDVLFEAYEKAKQESLDQDFILMLKTELKNRNLLN